jgi:hypothetical protein
MRRSGVGGAADSAGGRGSGGDPIEAVAQIVAVHAVGEVAALDELLLDNGACGCLM